MPPSLSRMKLMIEIARGAAIAEVLVHRVRSDGVQSRRQDRAGAADLLLCTSSTGASRYFHCSIEIQTLPLFKYCNQIQKLEALLSCCGNLAVVKIPDVALVFLDASVGFQAPSACRSPCRNQA